MVGCARGLAPPTLRRSLAFVLRRGPGVFVTIVGRVFLHNCRVPLGEAEHGEERVAIDCRVDDGLVDPGRLLERLLEEVSFSAGDLAGQQNGTPIVIDAAYVNSHLGELAQDEDLSRYIL